MAEEGSVVHEYEPHEEAYGAFVKLTMATVLAALFVLVGLLAIGFAQSFSLIVAGGTIVVGFAAVTLTLMTGGRNWIPSFVLLVLSFLLTVTLI